jgi:hypothetical protein
MEKDPLYRIPLKFRRMENLHIVFWLFKDISWCMVWRELGIIMILPTMLISIIIAWRTRHYVSELCHNLAITFWISANSYWMISEFLKFDAIELTHGYTYKHLALIPFFAGILVLIYYYIIWKPRHHDEAETM